MDIGKTQASVKDVTHLDVLLYCEVTNNDENLNEPVLEMKYIGLVCEMGIYDILSIFRNIRG